MKKSNKENESKINEIVNRKWMSMKQKAGSLKRWNKSINP